LLFLLPVSEHTVLRERAPLLADILLGGSICFYCVLMLLGCISMTIVVRDQIHFYEVVRRKREAVLEEVMRGEKRYHPSFSLPNNLPVMIDKKW
jgi:hypothetical protein